MIENKIPGEIGISFATCSSSSTVRENSRQRLLATTQHIYNCQSLDLLNKGAQKIQYDRKTDGNGRSSTTKMGVSGVSGVWKGGILLYLVEYWGPYASPAFRSMISRSGPRSRVNAWASNSATLSFGFDESVRATALTVAARGARRRSESSGVRGGESYVDDQDRGVGPITSEIISFYIVSNGDDP